MKCGPVSVWVCVKCGPVCVGGGGGRGMSVNVSVQGNFKFMRQLFMNFQKMLYSVTY